MVAERCDGLHHKLYMFYIIFVLPNIFITSVSGGSMMHDANRHSRSVLRGPLCSLSHLVFKSGWGTEKKQ